MKTFLRTVAPAAAVGGAALAVVGLLDPALHAGDSSAVAAPAATASAEAPADAGTGTGSGASAAPSTQASTQASAAPSTQASSGASAAPSTQAGSGTADGTTDGTTAGGTCSGETVTGTAVDTEFGPVQVEATVSDGAICAVHAVVYPVDDHHSSRINAYAIPVLDAAATAQGVEFDAVGGATITSEAYRESLQSILDQVG